MTRAQALLGVWTRQPADPAALTARERHLYAALRGDERRREWLTGRHALRVLLGLLGLDPDTAGYAFPHRRLSLSHAAGGALAAAAATAPPWLTGVGVDLEPPRPARPGTARFFLGDHELAWLRRLPPAGRAAEQLRLWTVKEALLKADPHNHRTVLRDYALSDPGARRGGAAVGHRPPAFRYATWTGGALPPGAWLTAAVCRRPSARPSARKADPVPASPALTFADVAERVSATLNVPVERLTPRTTLRDLPADSFLLVEMAIDLQEEFGTVFGQRELREVATLGELAALVGAVVEAG
jgi:acyl carrier protein/4'-phosphopantetheinyl transferase EntD